MAREVIISVNTLVAKTVTYTYNEEALERLMEADVRRNHKIAKDDIVCTLIEGGDCNVEGQVTIRTTSCVDEELKRSELDSVEAE